jgi:alpha-1,2-mannosyltransferase
VDFIVNASYPLVLDWLSKASVGLSTMVDEHFGINVVEFMVSGVFFSLLGAVLIVFLSQAAGVIPIAHASGGPLKDIIVPFNGENTGKLPGFFSTHSDHYSLHSLHI